LRNSLFFQIILFLLIILLLIFIVIYPDISTQSSLFRSQNLIILLLILFSVAILSAAFIASRYIKPIRKITDNISHPVVLTDLFYNDRRLPSEIQRLLRAIIRYQTNSDESETDYLAERKMFNSLLENMNDGILIADKSGNVTLINPCTKELFKVENKKIIGLSLAETLRNHHVNELWQKCIFSQQQEMVSFEIPSTKSFIQCIASPLAPELPGSILLLFQDLTRMRQLEIIRRDFVSNVSHELRTPLASLKLITETLKSGALDDPPAANRFLKKMDHEVDNLTQMVEELLELSRIESGQVPLERQWIKPQDLIHIAGERMEMQADRAGLEFSYACDPALPSIFVDPSRMSQVLINLIHNAIKFTPPGGKIETFAYREGNTIIFCVKDSGIGIPEKDLERVFERFYKSDRSRTQRGTGLGLSISKHLVEKHGGKIWVESSRKSGSTFKFSIAMNRNF
jgi:two-component system, OmpR family, phosphate regulon sensor histidine kinase PhoR